MKRLLLLILGLGLAVAIYLLGRNVWQTTQYFESQGREAKLVIGKRYNAERWASPYPIKKIHTYTAKLEPQYEVLVETDQELKDGETRTIRFLSRDLANEIRDFSARPIANALRLRGASDGAPVKLEDTALFDALVDKWMGPPAKGVYIRPRAQAEAAPDTTKATVPFVFATSDDTTLDIVWTNSRAQEWMLLGLGLLVVQSLLIAAYDRHKDARVAKKRGPLHPSLRKIEAAAPETPSKKLTYVPRPDEEIVLPDAEKKRLAAQAAAASVSAGAPPPPAPPPATPPSQGSAPVIPPPPSLRSAPPPPAKPASLPPIPVAPSAPPPTKAPVGPAAALGEPASLMDRETAPPMPLSNDVVLKLRRKSSGGGAANGETPPSDTGKSAS